jgi:hypothetical protein
VTATKKMKSPKMKRFMPLFLAEYQSVRLESVQSFENAQSIIKWSLATYGVLFGAGLIAATQPTETEFAPLLKYASLVIYSILLPGLVCVATWQWLGEITRMERVGVYLRGLERAVRNATEAGEIDTFPGIASPLGWETFLFGKKKAKKRSFPYVGSAGMFGGAFLSSLAFASFWLVDVYQGDTSCDWAWWLIPMIGIFVLFLTVSLVTGLKVVRLGGDIFDPLTGDVERTRSWRYRRSRGDHGGT